MGEIADMMIDGTLDFYTGEYIGRGKGIPRTLDRSLPWEQGNKNHNAKSGVTKWLHKNGITNGQQQMDIIRKYLPDEPHSKSKQDLCIIISKDFQKFAAWFNKEKPTTQH